MDRRAGWATAAVASLACGSLALTASLVSATDGTAAPTVSHSPAASPSEASSPLASPSASLSDGPSSPPAVDPPGTEQYIVVTDDARSAQEAKDTAVRLGALIDQTLVGAVDGFSAAMDDQQLAVVEDLPGVEYVEPDRPVSIDAPGSAVRADAGCTTNSLGRIDDGSSGSLSIGFPVNWFGTEYTSLFINNNGGVVLDDGQGGFTSYRGIDLSTTTRPLLLPLFTDLDTRNPLTSTVTYGQVTNLGGASGVNAFCVNWVNVGEYPQTSPRFSAQLVLIDRGSGNVDVEFNYDSVGLPTSTSNGTFTIGYSDPVQRSNTWSLVTSGDSPAAYVDGAASALNAHLDAGGTVEGRFTRQIRPGAAPTASPSPSPTPSPTSTSSCGITPPAGSYACPTWGLDRIDSRTRTYDQYYTPAGDGSGVVAYVVDTGVRQTHNEFAGRIGAYQYDAVDYDTTPQDCHGHGTHVAGTVAGTNYGVARAATIVGVRVLNCSGSGYTSGVVAGLNWIAANHATYYPGRRGVANMSLGGGASKTLDDAVQAVIDAGVPVVVAAGNDNADAQGYSPARVADAITVAASDSADARAYFSNYGSVVDLFAPGVGVLSAAITSDTATATYSGTSMASPHVAGGVAIYLALHPTATVAAVSSGITSAATTDVISDPAGSVNRLLYVRSFGASSPPTSSATPTPSPDSGSTGSGVGGGSGAGGGGGSTGGGGSLQEITEVRPAFGPVSGGNTVAVIGYGFTGASSVTIGGKAASFRVINDATVEVTMPAADAPGSADVAINLSASRGRAFAPGGYVYRAETTAPVSPAPSGESVTVGTSPADDAAPRPTSPPPARLDFRPKSAELSGALKSRLTAMARSAGAVPTTVAITAYSDARSSPASIRLARERARAAAAYLRSAGLEGTFIAKVRPGRTPAQRRAISIRLQAQLP